MSALLNPAINRMHYQRLLDSTLPHVIQTEEENEFYRAQLEALHERGNLSAVEDQLSQLLTLLIEDFEERHYQIKLAAPVEVLRELMAIHQLKQSDLLDVFGTPSIVSEVLNEKRELSKQHIQKLSQRFQLSPALFFPPL